eukprot:COSAG05_NODE_23064_length_260_cov_0.962733_1_plen_53_part_10
MSCFVADDHASLCAAQEPVAAATQETAAAATQKQPAAAAGVEGPATKKQKKEK